MSFRLIKLNREEETDLIKNLYLIGYNKIRNLESNLNLILKVCTNLTSKYVNNLVSNRTF